MDLRLTGRTAPVKTGRAGSDGGGARVVGSAFDLASGVAFLASPVSSSTTGADVLIDGALTRGIQL